MGKAKTKTGAFGKPPKRWKQPTTDVVHFARVYRTDLGDWAYAMRCDAGDRQTERPILFDETPDMVNCAECLRLRHWDTPVNEFLGDRLTWEGRHEQD